MNKTITIKMNQSDIMNLKNCYNAYLSDKTPPYSYYQIKLSDCVITAYESGKVVFQGEGSAFYADNLQSTSLETNVIFPHIGSDEVGTGDVFGPICVCAAFVQQENISFLKQFMVQDSKGLKDDQIRVIAPKLIERLPHSLLILDNAKYNQIHQKYNLNAIKAKLHNQCYLHLQKKIGTLPTIYLDQFTPPTSYFRYLKDETNIIKEIHFETKAENKYLGVACGSIIARYAFLKAMDALERQYDFHFPKGAGKSVDKAIIEFIKVHGTESLWNVSKVHFSNIQKVLNNQ